KLAAERPLKDIRDEYNYPKKKGIKDECSRLLEASTMKSRRGFAIQRLMNAMRQAHADGWFIVFDKQASHFVHIPGLSYSGVKSPTECQQSLFESHFASRQSLSDCPVAF